MTFEFKMATTGEILEKRGLDEGGEVQQYIDSTWLRLMDPYVPFDTGMLRDNGIINTVIGSGEIVYAGPYAHWLYYNPQFNFQGAPLRGGEWHERCKADKLDEVKEGAARIAGGKAE